MSSIQRLRRQQQPVFFFSPACVADLLRLRLVSPSCSAPVPPVAVHMHSYARAPGTPRFRSGPGIPFVRRRFPFWPPLVPRPASTLHARQAKPIWLARHLLTDTSSRTHTHTRTLLAMTSRPMTSDKCHGGTSFHALRIAASGRAWLARHGHGILCGHDTLGSLFTNPFRCALLSFHAPAYIRLCCSSLQSTRTCSRGIRPVSPPATQISVHRYPSTNSRHIETLFRHSKLGLGAEVRVLRQRLPVELVDFLSVHLGRLRTFELEPVVAPNVSVVRSRSFDLEKLTSGSAARSRSRRAPTAGSRS